MADPSFFDRVGPFSVEALAELSGARLRNPAHAGRVIGDVAPLEKAGPDDLTFLDNRKYVDAFSRSGAGAAFVDERLAQKAPADMALLVTREPYKAYARAAQAFYPIKPVAPYRAPSAIIDPIAVVPPDCDIGAHVVIAARSARIPLSRRAWSWARIVGSAPM
jgi:UDP-3-O-[3-hydroxymyristoyl] glucosamine N-acyltransferase